MTKADLEPVLGWRNHVDVQRFALTQHEISLEEHARWFAKASTEVGKFLLVFESAGTGLGFVQFSGAIKMGVADWGFYAAPNAPKGTGRALGLGALDFVFQTVGVRKVCGQVLDFNEPSIRFHRRLGFMEEGVLRDRCEIAGHYHDLICFGLLQRDWLEIRGNQNG